MRQLSQQIIGSALVSASLFFWSGCGSSADIHAGHDHAGHDHAGHDHAGHDHAQHARHGEPGHVHEPGDEHDADSGHTHVGQHGGRLIVLGDEDYHAELVIDHDRGEVTVRILDQTGRKPVHIDQDEITLNVR